MTNFSLFRTAVLCLILGINNVAFAKNQPHQSILVLGDSLSSAYGINTDDGWVALLRKRLQIENLQYVVINASVSGDTTRTGLNRLNPVLKKHNPDVVIIALGGNDGLRGLELSEIESSLREIIQRSKAAGAKVLLAGVRLPTNYGVSFNKKFANLFQRLALNNQVSLVPEILKNVAEHPDLMQEDGIHPKASAQKTVMNNVWQGLKPLLK